jgi:putative transposase
MDCNQTESENSQVLAQNIAQDRNMPVVKKFLSGIVKIHGNHPGSTDGGTWYPMTCRFLGLKHYIHSPFEKSLIGRTIQYIKDGTESFDNYLPCRMKNCKLNHLQNRINLFVNYHYIEVVYA